MFARITTVAFEGIEARAVDVQVQIGPGLPHFASSACPTRPWPRAASGFAAR
jgi:magnesium chelatase family protein